ncbi:kinase-like domain-containing protein [Absidia repens]|uniref:non-specific serine/threonine protein kinase n=1 Tax=Absidia repens TaxID=90262 RepID=A0A1X2I0J8_9FUNG|nr:kinase-like domain-containing protein [Absidia repens]
MDRLDDSPECTSYFWCRPSEVDSETSSLASPYSNTVFESEDLSYFIQHSSTSSSQRSSPQGAEQPFWDPNSSMSMNSKTAASTSCTNTTLVDGIDPLYSSPSPSSSTTTTTQSGGKQPQQQKSVTSKNSADQYKRRQTKMLLVSLIESFCRIYGDSPDANRKVFFLICQTLKSLGIIDAEFIDEMASVRTTFQRTFHKLFYAALHTVQTEPLMDDPHHQRQRLLLPANEKRRSQSSSSTSSSHNHQYHPSSRSDRSDSDHGNSNQPHDNPLALVPPTSPPTSWLHSPIADAATDSYSTTPDDASYSSQPHHRRKALFDLSIHHSRYHNDFFELGLLGRGGFARAYRVKNKLDGIDYAVKKVQLGRDLQNGKTPYKKIFREIKHLARLEHPNVIRYYASWLEYDAGQIQNDDDEDEDEDDDDDGYGVEEDTGDNGHLQRSSSQRKKTKELLYRQGSISQPASPSYSPPSAKQKVVVHGGWTLFIQMQLCQTTLHDYIDIRNRDYGVVDPDRNIALFRQILKGTAYIHEQGLIHRDLKPSNIFLTLPSSSCYPVKDDDGQPQQEQASSRLLWNECIPKIGDFGLAAALVDEEPTVQAQQQTTDANNDNSPTTTATTTTTTTTTATTTATTAPMLYQLKTAISSSSPSTSSSTSTTTTLASPTSLKDVVHQSRRRTKLGCAPPPASRRRFIQRAPTIGIGTRTYASPEQLSYSGRPYDEKVDVYSLGIIFFELYQPFTTWMERADAISNLKNAMLPDGFVEKYPKESALILWMMDHNPERRPSVKQLLNYEVFTQPPTDMLATLTAKLQAKSEALDTKNKQVEALQVDMKRMEMEQQLEREEMQRKLDELQQKLDSISPCT